MAEPRGATDTSETRTRLVVAGRRLFARDGVDGTRLRELNELAGQRNASALHYHFGTRDGLVAAILLEEQERIDADTAPALDALEASGTSGDPRALVEALVGPMVARLDTEEGRDWALIVQQWLPRLSDRLRRGQLAAVTPTARRSMRLLERTLSEHTKRVRQERLVAYSLVVTTLLAERAHQLRDGTRPALGRSAFETHLVDVLVAVLTAPSRLPGR